MGEYKNKDKFIICFEYLSYEHLAEKNKYGFTFFKNFEELEIFTNDEKIY